MFSTRLPWDETVNRWAQTHDSAKQNGGELWDLTQSNPTQLGLLSAECQQLLQQTLLQAAHDVSYQPNPQGSSAVRHAIAAYYQQRGLLVDPAHVVVCASTSEAYTWLFQLLCQPGDSVWIPQPSYPLFEQLAGLSAVQPRPYRWLNEGTGWWLPRYELENMAFPPPKALVVVHPNNPTGWYVNQADATWLSSWGERTQTALIADEVFLDYAWNPDDQEQLWRSSFTTIEQGGLRFVLSGLSKVLGLPQTKLAWIVIAGPEPLRTKAQQHLELIADTFLSVSSVAEQTACALLPYAAAFQQPLLQRIRNNHGFLQHMTRQTAVRPLSAQAGAFAVLRIPRLVSDEEWALVWMNKDQTLVYPGYFFDMLEEGHMVVSLLCQENVFQEGIRRLLRRVEGDIASLEQDH